VVRALDYLEANFDRQVEEWIHLTEIPAPSGHEEARARYLVRELEALGLEVRTDSIGNVVARWPGSGNGPTIVFSAHMDTVFPLDTDVSVTRDGHRLRAPGVGDNTKALSNMLAAVRAMVEAGIETGGEIILLGTAQEELGLKGMSYWLDQNPGVADMVIAMDGGFGLVRYGALGIYWTRYTFLSDGAHTNESSGKPHPVLALGRAARAIYELEVPEGRGGAVYNIGMVEGGDVFNAIPEALTFTVDLRSVNPVLLDSLHAEIDERVAAAAEAEGVGWGKEEVMHLPAGGTEEMLAHRREHPLILTAVDVHRHLGIPVDAVATGSTDANAAVARGIPAIAVGGSYGGGAHTVHEWADIPSALDATRMLLLLFVSLSGVAGG
jgi:tripeptide aminopeptidase